jgi:hypothetical protein
LLQFELMGDGDQLLTGRAKLDSGRLCYVFLFIAILAQLRNVRLELRRLCAEGVAFLDRRVELGGIDGRRLLTLVRFDVGEDGVELLLRMPGSLPRFITFLLKRGDLRSERRQVRPLRATAPSYFHIGAQFIHGGASGGEIRLCLLEF